MLPKRSFIRDMRSAHQGLSRRIRLRTRVASATPVASADPLADAAAAPSTDTLSYVTGQFNLLKSTQAYDIAGVNQQARAVVYFHPIFLSLVQGCYSMYIGGTGKEWNCISPVEYDDSRASLKVIVEASQ